MRGKANRKYFQSKLAVNDSCFPSGITGYYQAAEQFLSVKKVVHNMQNASHVRTLLQEI